MVGLAVTIAGFSGIYFAHIPDRHVTAMDLSDADWAQASIHPITSTTSVSLRQKQLDAVLEVHVEDDNQVFKQRGRSAGQKPSGWGNFPSSVDSALIFAGVSREADLVGPTLLEAKDRVDRAIQDFLRHSSGCLSSDGLNAVI